MSSLFSVSKLLAKGRAKSSKRDRAAPPTRSSSSISGEKEKISTIPYSASIAVVTQEPVVSSETPRAGPSLDLESVAEKGPSSPPVSLGEFIEILPETSKKDESDEEPDYAIIPHPEPQTTEVITSDNEKVQVVDEPGNAVVLHPEAKTFEVESTTFGAGKESDMKEKNADSEVATVGVKEVDIPSKDETGVVSEDTSLSIGRIQEVEDALKVANEELQSRSGTIEELQTEIERMSAEVERLKTEKEEVEVGAGREKQELREEILRLRAIIEVERVDNGGNVTNLEKENDVKLERIHRLEQRLDAQREEAGEVYARNRELEAKLQRHEEDIVEERDLVAEKESHIRMVEMNNDNLGSQLVQLKSVIDATERENRMLLDQIHQQSNELQVSKGANHLSTATFGRGIANPLRESQAQSAMTTIKMLNEEIFHTAASLTDHLESVPKRFVIGDVGASAMAEILKSMLGLELVKTLQEDAPNTSEDYNPFIQIALQGCLIASCMQIITSWYPAEWEYGNFLVALYERIRGIGGPDIALLWRKATQQSCVPSTDRNTKLVARLTEQVHVVLTVCGWSKHSEVEEMLQEKYSQKLTDIVSHAIRLNSLTVAGASGDLAGMMVEAGKVFDPEQMVNDSPFGSSDESKLRVDRPSEEDVVCTVALGLKRVDGTGVEADQILLKPKVVLNGALW